MDGKVNPGERSINIVTERTSGGIRAKTYGFAQQENLKANRQPDVDF
jgi:hypothetical protein